MVVVRVANGSNVRKSDLLWLLVVLVMVIALTVVRVVTVGMTFTMPETSKLQLADSPRAATGRSLVCLLLCLCCCFFFLIFISASAVCCIICCFLSLFLHYYLLHFEIVSCLCSDAWLVNLVIWRSSYLLASCYSCVCLISLPCGEFHLIWLLVLTVTSLSLHTQIRYCFLPFFIWYKVSVSYAAFLCLHFRNIFLTILDWRLLGFVYAIQ